MKCPFCGNKHIQVLESRSVEDGKSVRRRRLCESCKKRFTTHESPDATLLWVLKKSGQREPFEREKIRRGVMRAIEKRPVTLSDVDTLLETVEQKLMNLDSSEVATLEVGKLVLKELEKLDKRPSKVEENLNLITIESPEELEEVPGVISYILGALASEGINVVEFISCYTDTLLVVKQADTERAYSILSRIME